MPKRQSTVKIIDGKVIFSQEILDYFENLRTEENSEWIDKYFEVLSDDSNIDIITFDVHHIIPAFIFKNKIHKSRKETEFLANQIKENLINLSPRNHRLAHYYLWHIFKNEYSRRAVYIICGKEKNIEKFTEDEFKEFSNMINDCRKVSQTKQERLQKMKDNYRNNREKRLENQKEYQKAHKKEKAEYDKKRRKKYTLKLKKFRKDNDDQLCIDPIKKDCCTYGALKARKRNHKEIYENINPKDCIIQKLKYRP